MSMMKRFLEDEIEILANEYGAEWGEAMDLFNDANEEGHENPLKFVRTILENRTIERAQQ